MFCQQVPCFTLPCSDIWSTDFVEDLWLPLLAHVLSAATVILILRIVLQQPAVARQLGGPWHRLTLTLLSRSSRRGYYSDMNTEFGIESAAHGTASTVTFVGDAICVVLSFVLLLPLCVLLYIIMLTMVFLREGPADPHPISFGIPHGAWVRAAGLRQHAKKTRDFAVIVPSWRHTYIYQDEESYYEGYASAYYAVTMRKGGWDCLRHYEIILTGSVPFFLELDEMRACHGART